MTHRGAEQFSLRMPDGLRERIKESAKANLRTMNAEIVAQLLKIYGESEPKADTAMT